MKTAARIKELVEAWMAGWYSDGGPSDRRFSPMASWSLDASESVQGFQHHVVVDDDEDAKAVAGLMVHAATRSIVVSEMARQCVVGLGSCESPIERMMLAGLWIAALEEVDGVRIEPPSPRCDPSSFETILISPQHNIGEYRADFLLTYIGYDFTKPTPPPPVKRELVVECDGHDFHEKTKKQASRDKRRDRALQKAGYRVFRYSGSDIWKDVMTHAQEAIDAVMKGGASRG